MNSKNQLDWIKKIQEEIKDKTIETLINKKIININKLDKGSIGKIIENLFGVENNCRKNADLENLNIEIKSTPMKLLNDKTFTSKERLVCSIINYNEIVSEKNFFESSFYKKNRKILIVFYQYFNNKPIKNYKILNSKIFDLNDLDDLNQIIKDYEIIKNKVLEGNAHLISGSDTKILEACTKGSDSSSIRSQPFSETKAKQRAFAFKNSFVKKLYYSINSDLEISNFSNNSLDVINQIKKYQGYSLEELINIFEVNCTNKSYRFQLILKILNVKSLDQIKYFRENNATIKTIILNENNKLKEHIPLCRISLSDIENDFIDSEFYDFLCKKYIFVVFKKEKKSMGYLYDIKEISFDKNDIKNAEIVFSKTQEVLKNKNLNSVELIYKNLIKSSDNLSFHIRPKAINKNDTFIVPNGVKITKLAFWLNNQWFLKKYKDS